MPLDPAFEHVLDRLRELNMAGANPATIQAEYLRLTGASEWALPEGVTAEDLEVDGPHGPIPVRMYRPRSAPTAALLWMHGGGFTFGDLDMPEAHIVSAELAARGNALVASVAYRLAGEGIRFPVPLDDVMATWKWLVTIGARQLPLHAIGGASAGSTLALGAALLGRDTGCPADALLLAYPFAHHPIPQPRTSDHLEVLESLPPFSRITPEWLDQMLITYVGRSSELPPLAVPGTAPLVGLPPVRIVASEYDDIRPSAEQLRKDLTDARVPVRVHLAKGMIHGHLNAAPSIPEVDASLDFFAEALATGQRGGPTR